MKSARSSIKIPISKKPLPDKSVRGLLLRYPLLWLILIPLILYFRTLFLDFTRLDDTTFILDNQKYNADPANIAMSFHRGVFSPKGDCYYRPLFLADIILESRFFGISPAGYHFTNLLFHIISVVLLFLFFKKVKLPTLNALILSSLFAVHPVLSQAVAWIPGRNDMLLMIFFLSGFILSFNYLKKPGTLSFTGQALCFLAALFTKETAVIIPLMATGFFLFVLKVPWKKLIPFAIGWGVAIIIWYLARATAHVSLPDTPVENLITLAIQRSPALLQYLGKIFFPFNLSVFPILQDISNFWGIGAVVLLITLIIISKSYFRPMTLMGFFWYFIFLLPVLLVPKSINDQVFEHRLYIPFVGILLILSQTILFSDKWKESYRMIAGGTLVLFFALISFFRIGFFSDPVTFWSKAVNDSPHSSFAYKMLGLRYSESDKPRMEKYILKAYSLDPKEQNINYYLGRVAADHNLPDSAEHCYHRLLALPNQYPDYQTEACFFLAHQSFNKNALDSAAYYLEKVIELDPQNKQAYNNLVMLCLQVHKKDKAKSLLREMQLKGMEVKQSLVDFVEKN